MLGVTEVTIARDMGKNRGATNVGKKAKKTTIINGIQQEKTTNVVPLPHVITQSGAQAAKAAEKAAKKEEGGIQGKVRGKEGGRGKEKPHVEQITQGVSDRSKTASGRKTSTLKETERRGKKKTHREQIPQGFSGPADRAGRHDGEGSGWKAREKLVK